MDNGKPKFSNETLRTSELLKRKQSDPNYIALHKSAESLANTSSEHKIKREYLSNKFAAMRHLSDLYSGWLTSQGS